MTFVSDADINIYRYIYIYIMLELLGISRNSTFAGLCSQIDGLEWIAKRSFGWQLTAV